MKRIANKLKREEGGQALILVLVLLLVGGLMIGPLLGFMGTGLAAGQVHEQRMDELYAADAGIEDAIHKMLTDNPSLPQSVGDNWTYSIAGGVNDKGVEVVVELEEDVETFLEGLLDKDAGVHDEWAASSGTPVNGTYEITVIYTPPPGPGHENKKINGVGAWLQGVYDIRYYEEGHPKEGEPVYYGDLIVDYPNCTFEVRSYGGGTAFIWKWTDVNRPVFNPDAPDNSKSLTFEFEPTDDPDLYFSWLVGGSMDIGVVPEDIVIEVWKVISTATDSVTLKQTEVTSYVSRVSDNISILTWEISLTQ